MSSSFDPYYTWLAIPPEEQPADYYRLLGVRKYEANSDVISNAADQRMAHLRSFQSGKHSELSQKLLNEVSAARVTLLVPEKKQAYDEALRRREQKTAPAKPLPKAKPLEAVEVQPLVAQAATSAPAPFKGIHAASAYQPPTRKSSNTLPIAIVGSAVALFLLLMIGGGLALVYFRAVATVPETPVSPPRPVVVDTPEAPVTPAPTPLPTASPDLPATTPSEPRTVAPVPTPPQTTIPTLGQRTTPVSQARYAARTTRDTHVEVLGTAELTRVGSAFTAEVWTRWNAASGGQRMMGNWPHHSTGGRRVDQESGWMFTLFGQNMGKVYHGTGESDNSFSFPTDEQWHHLAFCSDKTGYFIYLDGKLALSKQVERLVSGERATNLYLGSADTSTPSDSIYRDFLACRVSRGKRYDAAFTPPEILESDADTVALLDFSTQQQVASDRSGQHHDGKLVGVEWVELQTGSVVLPTGWAQLTDTPLNLLDYIDQSHEARGRKTLEKGRKFATTLDTPVIAPVNVVVPEQYIVEATVTRRAGDDMFGIGLVMGGQQTMLEIDSFHGTTSGLDMIEGRRTNQPGYPKPFRGKLLKIDRPVKLRMVIGKNSISASADGEEFFAWQGDARVVSVYPIFRTRTKPGLSIVSWEGAFDITDFNLLPHDSGKTEVASDKATEPPLASPTPPVVEQAKLPAAPDAAAQKKSLEALRKVLKDDYDDLKKPEDKLALSTKLSKLARETTDDLDTQFVLYSEATRLAVEALRLPQVLSIIDEQARLFAVDSAALKMDAMKTLTPLAKAPADKKFIAETALAIANEAAEEQNFAVAEQLLRLASAAAVKASDPPLRNSIAQRAKEVDELQARWKLAQQAKARLQDEPGNAKANLVYGKFLCFGQGDWTQALSYLAKSENTALHAVVQEEVTPPDDPDKQLALADKWWTLGQAATADEKASMLARAHHWYRQSQPSLSGLSKAKAEKRREEIETLVSATELQASKKSTRAKGGGARTINLLTFVDPRADAVRGEWRMVDGVLRCESQHFVLKIATPYIPPEEYDVKMVFSQPIIRNDVCIIMPRQGKSFAWMLGGTEGVFHFSHDPRSLTNGQEPTRSNFPRSFLPSRQYTTLVQVRNDGVKAFFEGKQAAAFKTDYRDLVVDSWRTIPDPSRLAIGCDDPTIFHVLEVTEVTGQGKLLREPK